MQALHVNPQSGGRRPALAAADNTFVCRQHVQSRPLSALPGLEIGIFHEFGIFLFYRRVAFHTRDGLAFETGALERRRESVVWGEVVLTSPRVKWMPSRRGTGHTDAF
jgi:hypothetical protein